MAWFTDAKTMPERLSTATQSVMYRNPGLHVCTIPVVLYRLGYMFWSDVSHDVIVAARLNGTGLAILVNSSINVPGNTSLFRTQNNISAALFYNTFKYMSIIIHEASLLVTNFRMASVTEGVSHYLSKSEKV